MALRKTRAFPGNARAAMGESPVNATARHQKVAGGPLGPSWGAADSPDLHVHDSHGVGAVRELQPCQIRPSVHAHLKGIRSRRQTPWE